MIRKRIWIDISGQMLVALSAWDDFSMRVQKFGPWWLREDGPHPRANRTPVLDKWYNNFTATLVRGILRLVPTCSYGSFNLPWDNTIASEGNHPQWWILTVSPECSLPSPKPELTKYDETGERSSAGKHVPSPESASRDALLHFARTKGTSWEKGTSIWI